MIEVRNHNEYVAKAALHGIKMKARKVRREIIEADESTKNLMANIHKDMIKKKVEEKRKSHVRISNKNRGQV